MKLIQIQLLIKMEWMKKYVNEIVMQYTYCLRCGHSDGQNTSKILRNLLVKKLQWSLILVKC